MPIPTRAETLSDPTCQYAYFDLEPPPGHPDAIAAERARSLAAANPPPNPHSLGAYLAARDEQTQRPKPTSPGRPMPGQVVPGRPVVRIPRPDQVTASIRDMYFQKVKKVLGRIGGCPNAPATYPELRIIREAVERTADDLTIHNHIRDAAIFALHGRIEAVARLEAEENDYPDYPSDKATAALLERLSSEREIDMGNPPIFTAKQQYQARQKEARRQLRSQQRIEESEAEHKLRMEEMKWNSHFDDEFLLKRSIMEDKRAETLEKLAAETEDEDAAKEHAESASRKRFNAESDRSDAKKLSAQKSKGGVVQASSLHSVPSLSSRATEQTAERSAESEQRLLNLAATGAGCDAPPLLIAAS